MHLIESIATEYGNISNFKTVINPESNVILLLLSTRPGISTKTLANLMVTNNRISDSEPLAVVRVNKLDNLETLLLSILSEVGSKESVTIIHTASLKGAEQTLVYNLQHNTELKFVAFRDVLREGLTEKFTRLRVEAEMEKREVDHEITALVNSQFPKLPKLPVVRVQVGKEYRSKARQVTREMMEGWLDTVA